MDYKEQIKSPKWQKRRLEIMERDNFTCQICGCKDKTLHVHHTIYIPKREIWDYEDNQLITLCEDCHNNEHGKYAQTLSEYISEMRYAGFTNYEIINYLAKYSLGIIYPDSKEIQEFREINPRKAETLERLAKRRQEIDNKKYNLNDE